MKLVYITTVPNSLVFLQSLVSFAMEQGISVEVITSPDEELINQFVKNNNFKVNVHLVKMQRKISPFNDVISIYQLWRILRKAKPTIVHTHTPKAGLLGNIAAWCARVSVRVYHIHGLRYVTLNGLKKRVVQVGEWLSCKISQQVYCVSKSVREEVIRDGICSSGKIKVLHQGTISGIDASDRFNPVHYQSVRVDLRREMEISDQTIVIGFIGRIVKDKGIYELVTAFTKLSAVNDNICLLILGRFESFDPVDQEIVNTIRNHQKIYLLEKHVEHAMIPRYMSIFDILAFPSYREGFPLIPIESSAMEIPVIASRIPGCIDAIVENVTGTLIVPQDVEELEKAIRRYIDDPELRRIHGINGRKRVLDDFRPKDVWDQQFLDYQRLIQQIENQQRGI